MVSANQLVYPKIAERTACKAVEGEQIELALKAVQVKSAAF
jgi:hypothetical protein